MENTLCSIEKYEIIDTTYEKNEENDMSIRELTVTLEQFWCAVETFVYL